MSKYSEAEKNRLIEAMRYGRMYNIVEELSILFCNSVRYVGSAVNGVDADYITLRLLYQGCIGYVDAQQAERLGIESDWYEIIPVGTRNKYGFPDAYNLQYANNKGVIRSEVPYDAIHVIKANSKLYPWYLRFVSDAETIEKLETSMLINVQASRNTDIIPVKDEKTRLSINNFYDMARNGSPAVVVKDGDIADALRNKIENKTKFEAEKIQTLARTVWEEAVKRCGIVSANNFKRERVQTAEVNASACETIDYIYAMIDTFNRDAERAGIDVRMEANTAINDIMYGDESGDENGV